MSADAVLPGDRARRRTVFSFLALLFSLPLSILLFGRLEDIWAHIFPLEGVAFLLAATTLGLLLAAAPVIAAASFVMTIWFGVDSVYQPRQRQQRNLIDLIVIASALVVWLAPMLFCLGSAIFALSIGEVHFVRPQRDYLRATDPIAFWQGIGFWLIMTTLFGFLAWRYWQPKLFPRPAAQSPAVQS